jgi:hypothetical protein
MMPTAKALLAEFDGSVCPACHHRFHDPGSCSECPRCELHTDEALAFVLRVEPELLAPSGRKGVDLRQSLGRRSRAYHAAVHVKFPGPWEECPLSECFWDVSAIKMATASLAAAETFNAPQFDADLAELGG